MAMIVIDFDSFSGTHSGSLLILAQLPRLRNLRVNTSDKSYDLFAQAVRRQTAAPCLEDLEVSLRSGSKTSPDMDTFCMPRLKTLNTFGVSFPLAQQLVRATLTSLTIRSLPQKERVSLQALLKTLEGLPSLRNLKLWDVYRPGKGTPPTTPSVNLPRLDTLEMSSSRIAFGHMLEHLTLPLTTRFKFSSFERSRGGDKLLAGAMKTHILEPVCSTGSFNAPQSVLVDVRFANGKEGRRKMSLILKIWTDPKSLDDLTGNTGWELRAMSDAKLSLKVPLAEGALYGVIKELMASADLSTVTTMCISCRNQSLTTRDWVALLQTVPNLRELALVYDAVDSFSKIARAIFIPEDSAPPPLYPSLGVLRLAHVQWVNCLEHERYTFTRDWLIDALQKLRRKQGVALQRLEIKEPRNFVQRDCDVLVQADVARTVDVLDWGDEWYVECTEDARHRGEDRDERRGRIWRVEHYQGGTDDSDEEWGQGDTADEEGEDEGDFDEAATRPVFIPDITVRRVWPPPSDESDGGGNEDWGDGRVRWGSGDEEDEDEDDSAEEEEEGVIIYRRP